MKTFVQKHQKDTVSYHLTTASWPILLTLRKFRQIFLKIKLRGPPIRNMPRHKLEVLKLLITAKEPVETVS